MKYKLLALDLDGTLLTDDKRISDRGTEALQATIDAGAIVVFCTGRRYRTVIPMVEQIDRHILVAYNNGAAVRECPLHRTVIKNLFPERYFVPVIDILAEFDLSPVIHIDAFDESIDLICATGDTNAYHRAYVSRNAECLRELDDLRTAPADRIVQFIVMEPLDKLRPAQEALLELSNDHALNIHIVKNLNIPVSALEVLDSKGEKWYAVARIADRYGIKPEEVVAIGDDISDRNLLLNAGVGIAVENALDEVKAAADLLVPTNNEDGASIAIERFFL